MLETNIDSFILRFVHEQAPEGSSGTCAWHGVIRHVQSNRQIRFSTIEEALAFVAGYVDLGGQRPQGLEAGRGEDDGR